MQFNRYVWSFFASSKEGRKEIAAAQRVLDGRAMLDRSDYSDAAAITDAFASACGDARPSSKDDGIALYEKLLTEGVRYIDEDGDTVVLGGPEGLEEWVGAVGPVSTALARVAPDLFAPYAFQRAFDLFARICGEFAIPLPDAPGKGSWERRARYYLELNDVLQEFRGRYQLTPAELCAFLHAFAPACLETAEESELPPAGRAWFLIGGAGNPDVDFGFLDDADEDASAPWQGSVDTRIGDICVMWCVQPRSYIHSVWRAVSDGFVDPFFHFHSTIRIAHPTQTPHITFKEIASDPTWSQKPAVRAHFQGASGKPVTTKEYDALVAMLARRGMDTAKLPKLSAIPFDVREDLASERDIEVELLEPLLKRLGFAEPDWVRQLPIRMGRGERVYPDYVLGAVSRRGEESARVLVEAKFRLDTRKALEEAYIQAKSYALRLQARAFLLAAREGVWLLEPGRTGFSLDRCVHKRWDELSVGDDLHAIASVIGKGSGTAWR